MSEKSIKVGKLPVGFKPEAPPPLPLKSLIIGPAIIALGLSIGSGELIFWPIMSSVIGPVLLWAALISLIFQTIWTLEMARWTVWTGEHWVLQMARVHGLISAVTLWGIFTFLAWGFGGWAAAAGSATYALVRAPGTASIGTVVWASILFFFVWLVALLAGIVREWVEKILTAKMIIIWIMLIVSLAVITAKVPYIWGDIGRGVFVPTWPSGVIGTKQLPYFTLAAAIAFIGAGGTTNMWYSFWVRDAGYGMGAYIGRIPGYLRGRPVAIELTGYLPEPSSDNIQRIKAWWRNVQGVFWLIFFLLNYLTAVFFVALVYGGKELGLVKPAKGVEVIQIEAKIVETVFGGSWVAAVIFMIVAIVLLFGTQLSITEGVARQLADTMFIASERIRRFFKNDIRSTYFWIITAFVIWDILWISLIYIAGIKPILLLALPANINLVYQVISAPLTVYFLYGVARKSVPPELWREMRPHPIIPVLMILGAIFWGYFAALGWGERLGLLP
ncbi:MAG: Nramp family divalent metal transporter [Pyrodictiaceae archaeon]